MQMKFYSPLTADFFPNEPDYEDEFYDEYEGYPQDGHELLEYETAIRDAVENDTRDFGGDLMQYYHEDDSVRNKVVTAVRRGAWQQALRLSDRGAERTSAR